MHADHQDWYEFDCGCRIPIDRDLPPVHGRPSLVYRVEDMPLDCPRVWDMLGKGLTKGVFQLESKLGRKWVKRLRPENIEHLAALTALLRPGCLRSKDERGVTMTELYCRRKNDEEISDVDIDQVRHILQPTYGVIVYQEQTMQIARELAGFDLVEVDKLRKSIGKKDQQLLTAVGDLFIKKADEYGIITHEQAVALFDNIRKSGRYQFNKAHSVSYAYDAYFTAHEKAHFPLEFFTSYLYHAKEKQKPLEEIRAIVNEAKIFEIEVNPPRFSDLEEHFFNNGVEIRFGLSDVKGVGEKKVAKMKAAMEVAESEAGGKLVGTWSWFDFLVYFSEHVDSTLVKRMIEVGALRDFRMDRVRLLAEYDAWRRLSDGERKHIAGLRYAVTKDVPGDRIGKFVEANPGCLPDPECLVCNADGTVTVLLDDKRPVDNLPDAIEQILLRAEGNTLPTKRSPSRPKWVVSGRRREVVESIRMLLLNPASPLVDKPYWIAKKEEEALGLPITCTHVDSADKSRVNATCKDIRDGVVDAGIVGVEIQDVHEIQTKNGKDAGKTMGFLTVSDETGELGDVVVFASVWEQFGGILAREHAVVAIAGRRDPSRGGFIVDHVWEI